VQETALACKLPRLMEKQAMVVEVAAAKNVRATVLLVAEQERAADSLALTLEAERTKVISDAKLHMRRRNSVDCRRNSVDWQKRSSREQRALASNRATNTDPNIAQGLDHTCADRTSSNSPGKVRISFDVCKGNANDWVPLKAACHGNYTVTFIVG